MNIKTLQLFLHICSSQNFSQSANAMHISPSALSRQIQKLEQQVGKPLFVRDNRRVELTETGKKLLDVASNISTQWQQFCIDIQDDSQELSGEIRLFCSVTASFSHLPQLLRDFRLTYPKVELKLSTGDPAKAIERLIENEADIVLCAMPTSLPARLCFQPIGEIPLSVIAPTQASSFSAELQKETPDWAQIPFIIPITGTARERSNTWFKKMKFKPTIYSQTSGGHEAIVSMVALGLGVGIAPDVVINNSPVKEKVQRLNVASIEPFRLGMCCHETQLNNPLIKALWQIAQTKFIKA
ncbi:MAG: HTH-type transcriptional activator IlvY [Vibrio sp.]